MQTATLISGNNRQRRIIAAPALSPEFAEYLRSQFPSAELTELAGPTPTQQFVTAMADALVGYDAAEFEAAQNLLGIHVTTIEV